MAAVDEERVELVSARYDPSTSSETDEEEFGYFATKAQQYGVPRSWWKTLTSFRSDFWLYIIRRKKQALLLAIAFTAILFLAALYATGLDRKLASFSPSTKTKETHSGLEASAPKIKYCSSWPSIAASNDSRNDGVGEDLDKRVADGKPTWKKPKGFKIVAAVFYGRRRNVDVLDCYLQKNLVHNGGFLDSVQFMVHTSDLEDVAWIQQKTDEVEGYEYVDLGTCTKGSYGCIWNRMADNSTLYIKIDDDIVYVHHDAIPRLVQTRLKVPTAFAVSANLVNAPRTAYLHHHHGAIYPYLPAPLAEYAPSQSWRPSELPFYPGNTSTDLNVDKMTIPFPAHRWLPVSKNNTNYDNMATPIGRFDTFGRVDTGLAWRSWAVATQQHYSLLQHIEDGTMNAYHFGIWNTQWTRYNLNFAAIWGSDVRANLPIARDDEEHITASLPRKLGRPFLIETTAVVSHLHFGPQTVGVRQTDVLDRYRALANERICTAGNQKVPFDESCDWVKEWEANNSAQTDA